MLWSRAGHGVLQHKEQPAGLWSSTSHSTFPLLNSENKENIPMATHCSACSLISQPRSSTHGCWFFLSGDGSLLLVQTFWQEPFGAGAALLLVLQPQGSGHQPSCHHRVSLGSLFGKLKEFWVKKGKNGEAGGYSGAVMA